MQTVTLPSLGQAGYLFSLKFSSCEGREIPLSLWGGRTVGRKGCVCVRVRVCVRACARVCVYVCARVHLQVYN